MNKSNVQGVIYGDQDFSWPSHMNFGKFVLDKILKGKDRIALINGITDEKITFGEMAQMIVNTANSLVQMGVKRGDVVGICSENRIEFLISAIAIFCSGAVVTFINSAYSKDELAHTMQISKPKYMFLSPDTYKAYYETMRSLNLVTNFFVYGPASSDIKIMSFEDLSGRRADIGAFKSVDFNGMVQTALILYSSGTTGLPKGTKLSHRNLITAGLQPLPFTPGRNSITLAPWSNTMGIICAMDQLIHNQTVIYMSKFNEELYLKCIENYGVGMLVVVPPLIVMLNKSTVLNNYNINSVEIMYCGGAPLDNETIAEAKTKFHNLKHVLQGYGMTEASGALTEEFENAPKQGSVGKVVAGNIIKIVDVENRNILGPNQSGEVCIKGPTLFDGYIGRDLKEDLDDEGFYKTGDIAYYDEDGYFFVVDRLKELIKYKAGQVSPSELEALLLQHPAVKDVGVVGKPDPLAGELPTAFVVKKPKVNVTEKELMDYVAAQVSSWKQLRGGVRFVQDIPKNGSGKILRRILRESLSKPPASKL